MAVEITAAHRALINQVRRATIQQMKDQLDRTERLYQMIDEAGPSDVSMGQWSDAAYATQRTAIMNELHTLGAALVTEATAVHDAAAAVVTDWT